MRCLYKIFGGLLKVKEHNKYSVGAVCKVRANTVSEKYLLGEVVKHDGISGIYVRVLQDHRSPSALEGRIIIVDSKNITTEL